MWLLCTNRVLSPANSKFLEVLILHISFSIPAIAMIILCVFPSAIFQVPELAYGRN